MKLATLTSGEGEGVGICTRAKGGLSVIELEANEPEAVVDSVSCIVKCVVASNVGAKVAEKGNNSSKKAVK